MENQKLKESKKLISSSFRRPNYSNQGSSNDSNLETQIKGNFLIHLLILKLMKRIFQDMLQREGVLSVKASDTCKLIA